MGRCVFIENINVRAHGVCSSVSLRCLRVYERNGYSFLKSVYCLSGLVIVRKNRRISK